GLFGELETQAEARLAEYRPITAEPEVPLHDDGQPHVGHGEVVVERDAHVDRVSARAAQPAATVAHDVDAEADADGVVDARDEAVVHELDGAPEANSEAVAVGGAGGIDEAEQHARLELESVVRVCARALDDDR